MEEMEADRTGSFFTVEIGAGESGDRDRSRCIVALSVVGASKRFIMLFGGCCIVIVARKECSLF